jgi:acetyl esterase/lipase
MSDPMTARLRADSELYANPSLQGMSCAGDLADRATGKEMTDKRVWPPLIGLMIVMQFASACGAGRASPTPTITAEPTATAAPPPPTARDTAAAAPSDTPAATPGPYDLAGLGSVQQDITYCTAGGVPLKMDLYLPAGLVAPAPALVYVHGGGWTRGDKSSGAEQEVPEMVARGYVVAAVDYRLAPEYLFPAQIQDVKCAVRHLRANAAEYDIDPDRIGAWGVSAGGHLVSLLGLADASAGLEGNGGYADQSSRVQAVVDVCGPVDLTLPFSPSSVQGIVIRLVFGTADPSSKALKRASPVTHVSGDDPPFLIIHGQEDTVVPPSQSAILFRRLTAAGVSADLIIVANADHGFQSEEQAIDPSRPELTQIIADFFDEHLR